MTLELEYDPEGLVEKAGDALGLIERQAQSDLERFKTFIEARGAESGSWRGQVGAPTVGTPGVDLASSEGDSGKAGISPKVAAAGAAAVAAAGVAAAAATRGSSDEETEVDVVEVTEVEPAVGVVPDPEGMVGASDTDTTPLDDEVPPIDPILGTPAADDPADGRTV